MPKATMYYEWIVWFRDGNIIAQHKLDGSEIPWREVIDYHNRSMIQRVGFVPFSKSRAKASSLHYKKEYDRNYEIGFHSSWIHHVDTFVVPQKPDMDDKGIKRKIEKFEKAMNKYRLARKVPMSAVEWRRHTYKWEDNCVAKVMPSHFVEPVNGEIPLIVRRLEYTYFKGKLTYYYIIGSGGRKVKDNDGNIHYIDGYYQAIDQNGHTRLCHYSNVVVPVIPPEKADSYVLQVTEIEE